MRRALRLERAVQRRKKRKQIYKYKERERKRKIEIQIKMNAHKEITPNKSINQPIFDAKKREKNNSYNNVQQRGYHWAIYAPAAFLRTKSGLSWYGAPSMGSETTPPYA